MSSASKNIYQQSAIVESVSISIAKFIFSDQLVHVPCFVMLFEKYLTLYIPNSSDVGVFLGVSRVQI